MPISDLSAVVVVVVVGIVGVVGPASRQSSLRPPTTSLRLLIGPPSGEKVKATDGGLTGRSCPAPLGRESGLSAAEPPSRWSRRREGRWGAEVKCQTLPWGKKDLRGLDQIGEGGDQPPTPPTWFNI